MSQDWIDDCVYYWGIVLTGRNSHWCPDFDNLPIDDTCYEMEYCNCEKEYEDETIKSTYD